MFYADKLTSTSITIRWDGLDPAFAPLYGGYFEWYVDGSFVGTSKLPAGATGCEPITIGGLTPGTMYTISVQAWFYDAYGGIYDGGTDSTTVTTLSRPAYFAWTVPKTAGGQFYIGADEWKCLMNNIALVVNYATGNDYDFVYYEPFAGEIFTAARYNDLRAAIQSVPGYGYYIPQVSSGQIVTAQQLNLLVSELNAIP